ncbi:MAG: hypothetical protein COT81_00565 [Candidatus Buchananbacteria bacterium CG10_big_fil_rev_8_21_14_0_10_42_9]|uniref:POTRA domain-containing protein n=1 Tax=Candidatus Buchananbacteria bacterium CG10_big_fil_rev_8_21_14_0_10_42_9 TaxID=1974526 RepID=A0A2H0W2A2_9BACT|nr:MAG: hypothetical protein COT81_00565 [Candidatus Buchananbacteria bacterium CG10_big_fil_rev_8_21_14_0_10_42_9]
MAGLAYYLGTSEIFDIQTIKILNNQYIATSDLENLAEAQRGESRFFLFSQNNILFFNTRDLKKSINQSFILKSVSVGRNFINRTVTIRVSEKTSGIVWVSGSENYYVDLDGIATNVVRYVNASQNNTGTVVVRTKASREGLPIIYDTSNQPINIGSRAVSPQFIEFVISLNQLLNDATAVDVIKFEYNEGSGKPFLIVKSLDGYDILFNPEDSYIKQVNNLIAVLGSVIGNPSDVLYIDLRFGDKVIYK